MASLTCVNLPVTRVSQPQHQCKCSLQSAVLASHPRQSLLVRSQSVYSRRPTQGTPKRISCSASDFGEGELIKGIKAGDKLKVKESRVVYHAPKHKVSIKWILLSLATALWLIYTASHATGPCTAFQPVFCRMAWI